MGTKYKRTRKESERLVNLGKKYGGWNKTHGMSKSSFFTRYRAIIDRCRNPKVKCFPRYGGRGIKCLWNSFEEFRDDMYESYLEHVSTYGVNNTSIDRVDNSGNYCKENCRWVTQKENQRNRRSNRKILFKGENLTIVEWSEKTGIAQTLIWQRINKLKWPINKALTQPVRIGNY